MSDGSSRPPSSEEATPIPPGGKGLDILYVGMLPPFSGGTAAVNGQLLPELARWGHRVRALAPMTAEDGRDGDLFAQEHPEVAVTRYPVPFFDLVPQKPHGEGYLLLEREQIQKCLPPLIASRRPDILFIGRETFVLHVTDVARAESLPCVLGMHSGGLLRWMLEGSYPAALTQAFVHEYCQMDVLVAVSRHSAEDLRRLGFPGCIVIPNPVNLERFTPAPREETLAQELSVGTGDIVVAHLSNLREVKRPLDLVASAAEALRHNPRLLYLIVGDGPLRGAMEQDCRRRQIASRFRFTGRVDHGRVPAYLNLADLVAMPSEVENQSLVYLEAQACGRVLLASDIPAAREVVVDGATGLLFRKGNMEDLTAKTLHAAAEPRLRAAIGRKACEAARAHALPAVATAYVAALEEAIRRHRGRAGYPEFTPGGCP
jgi:glycosyltransferase involved in cell wall biosynthesis